MLLDYGGLRPTPATVVPVSVLAPGVAIPNRCRGRPTSGHGPPRGTAAAGVGAGARGSPPCGRTAPPTWCRLCALDGDTLVTAIDAKPKRPGMLARLRNIAWEPRVAVLADGWDEDWTRLWWVRLDG